MDTLSQVSHETKIYLSHFIYVITLSNFTLHYCKIDFHVLYMFIMHI
jgi:hypothetical protein